MLDLIRLFVGEVAEVSAYANTTPPSTPGADVDGATGAVLRFRSGRSAPSPRPAVWRGSTSRASTSTPTTPSPSTKTASPHGLPTGRYSAACGPTTPKSRRPSVRRCGVGTRRWTCRNPRGLSRGVADTRISLRHSAIGYALATGAGRWVSGLTVVVQRPGVVTLREEPPPGPIREGQFDVETVFSGLSTGTDLSWVKGTNPALHS